MSAPPNEHDLHAYVDGRLEAARRAEIEAWLSRHPEQLVEVQAWQRDAQQLRAALAGDGLTPVPELDPARVRTGLARRRNARYAMAVAVVLSIGVGGLGGWQAREWSRPPAPMYAGMLPMADAIQAHRLFAERHDLRPDRAAGDLQPWLNANFREPMRLPDLSASGFKQVGGRLLATDQGAAAVIVYEDAAGNAISFYIRPPGPRRHMLPRGDRRDGDLLAQYWSSGGYNYAMVSRDDSAGAAAIARVLDGAI
jgi:anti-sigma factor RsiW